MTVSKNLLPYFVHPMVIGPTPQSSGQTDLCITTSMFICQFWFFLNLWLCLTMMFLLLLAILYHRRVMTLYPLVLLHCPTSQSQGLPALLSAQDQLWPSVLPHLSHPSVNSSMVLNITYELPTLTFISAVGTSNLKIINTPSLVPPKHCFLLLETKHFQWVSSLLWVKYGH